MYALPSEENHSSGANSTTTKVAASAHLVTEQDRGALRDAGLTQDEAWDVAAIAAFFSMSNRLANAIDLKPNAEFQKIGRA